MIDYNLLYATLEAKANEGIKVLEKKNVGDSNYQQTLSDLLTTVKVVKTFEDLLPKKSEEEIKEGVKSGDEYISFNGDKEGNKIVIFTMDGCSHCEAMKPVYLPYLKNTDLIVENINISEEKYRDFIEPLGVHGAPTYFLVKDNILVHRFEGYGNNNSPEENLERLTDLIKTYL